MKISGPCISLLATTFLFASSCVRNGVEAHGSRKMLIDRLHRDYNDVIENRRRMTLTDGDLHKGGGSDKQTAGDYSNIRIIVDDAPLRDKQQPGVPNADYNAAILAMADEVMPQVVAMFESILYVKPPMDPVNLRNRGSDCNGVTLPEELMTTGDFYLILDAARDSESTECTSFPNLAALSETCVHDLFPLNPRAGIIRVCLDRVNVVSGVVESSEIERLVSLHLGELAVALGATSDLFSFYNDPETEEPYGYNLSSANCLDGTPAVRLPAIVQDGSYGSNGKPFFEITTPLVTQVAKNIFDCQSLSGARIENQPFKPSSDAGLCIGDGWDARLFYEEVLSNHVDASEAKKILSPLTLALLEDSGWYRVDFSLAGALTFGLGAGCSFVNEDCIDSPGVVSAGSKGIFCVDNGFDQCDFSYQSSAVCNVGFPSPPTLFQYFQDTTKGGLIAQTDFCPLAQESKNPCADGKRCFDRIGEESLCLDAICDDGEVIFDYGDVSYTCSFDFEEIEVTDLTNKVQCPRLAAFCPNLGCSAACSGRGVCTFQNDGAKCSCASGTDGDGCFANLFSADTGKEAKKGKKGGRARRLPETKAHTRRGSRRLKGVRSA